MLASFIPNFFSKVEADYPVNEASNTHLINMGKMIEVGTISIML